MSKVFISYSGGDEAASHAAKLVARRLRTRGMSVFFDRDSLVAGGKWSEQIREALEDSTAVVVLLSSSSRRSTWVESEVQVALERKKLIVPILLDRGATENWLWPLLAERHALQLDLNSPELDAQLHVLTTQIERAVGAPAEGSLRSNRVTIIAVAVASAIVTALVAWLLPALLR